MVTMLIPPTPEDRAENERDPIAWHILRAVLLDVFGQRWPSLN